MQQHSRRSIRLPYYDYAQPGVYFVTLVTQDRTHRFGEVVEGEMVLNQFGNIVQEEWQKTAFVRPNVEMDAFVIMPDHIHGILVITESADTVTGDAAGTGDAPRRPNAPGGRPNNGPPSGSLGAIIGQIKSITTKRINAINNTPGASIWQRNYYEHIIRTQEEWARIRWYIETNPSRWHR